MDTPIEGQDNAAVSDSITAAESPKPQTSTEPAAPAVAQPVKGSTKIRRQKQVTTVNTLTAESVTKIEVVESEDAELPKSVKLAAPYAFYEDEGGALRTWAAGQTVEDPAEIAILVERGALFEAE